MKFSQIDTTVESVAVAFAPYDRGQNGAFVYRKVGSVSVHAPRLVVSTSVNDTSSDKMTVQLNIPSVHPSANGGPDVVLGTDLVKTELRFLATTSKQDRVNQIDTHIALLQELRGVIEDRGVIYT